MNHQVYALSTSSLSKNRENHIFYIGYTSTLLRIRLMWHTGKSNNSHVGKRIKELRVDGVWTKIFQLAEFDNKEDAIIMERKLIKEYSDKVKLYNVAHNDSK